MFVMDKCKHMIFTQLFSGVCIQEYCHHVYCTEFWLHCTVSVNNHLLTEFIWLLVISANCIKYSPCHCIVCYSIVLIFSIMYTARCEHCLTTLGSHSVVGRKAAICWCFVLPKSGANRHRYAFVINVHKVLYTSTMEEVMASHASLLGYMLCY